MKLLIVILSYRVKDLTLECLRSLSSEISGVEGARVVVCDNGNTDDTGARLREAVDKNAWQNWAEVTSVYPNRGFTGGNNYVVRAALDSKDPPQYVLLLNADTLVLPNALAALVKFMDEHPTAGIAGSRLEWPDGSIQASPFRFQGVASELDRGLRLGIISRLLARWRVDFPTPRQQCEVDWVSGACMIIRREVLNTVGLLDEDYYTYFDDIDICLNAKRAGWASWFVPQSRIIHLEGASTGIRPQGNEKPKRRPGYWFEARRRFFLKNYGAIYTALADAAFIIGYALWRVRRALQGKPDGDPPHMLMDAIRNSVFCTGFKLRAVENPAMRITPPQGLDPKPA